MKLFSKENFRYDLTAAISVALVALPLGLGIAVASDAPPISGVLSAIAGGLIATFVRGSHVAINGPANSLIVVVADGVGVFKQGGDSSSAMPYVAAAFVMVGALQVLLGRLRFGSLAAYVPTSVIYGMLAAIGVIICAKQAHVAFGWHSRASSGLMDILTLPQSFARLNPLVTLIAFVSLLILILHPRIKGWSIQYVPAPILVLGFAIPAGYFFQFREGATWDFFGRAVTVNENFLVHLPDNLHETITYPNFTKATSFEFWALVLTLTLMASLESLLSCKAVDRLDPFKRKSRLNKDLTGTGLATMASGAFGGLPVVTVIARSSVNVNHGARTGMSNFLHGLILLILMVALPGLIREVPLAALAAVLMFAGYKLTAPKVFREASLQGPEQLVALLVTMFATLAIGLLPGIGVGLLTVLVTHLLLCGLGPLRFLRALVTRPSLKSEEQGRWVLRAGPVANFVTLPWLAKSLAKAPFHEHVIVDFSGTHLIDPVTLEYLTENQDVRQQAGGQLENVGLGLVMGASDHPLALRRRQLRPSPAKPIVLSARQKKLQAAAIHHGWHFRPALDWNCANLHSFEFFRVRPLLFRSNILSGDYADLKVSWEAMDVTFDVGVYLAAEEHHTTIQVLQLPSAIPAFTMDRASLMGELLGRAAQSPSYERYPDFSREWLVTTPDHARLSAFLTPEVRAFFEEEEFYHVESLGDKLMLFRWDRLATPREYMTILHHGEHMARVFLEAAN